MKLKLLLITLFISFYAINAQNLTSKRIKINNPTKNVLSNLQKAGIDLRCGAVFNYNSLELDLSFTELESLNKAKIPYVIEINDLTKFYVERSAKDLPFAKTELAYEKAKKWLGKKETKNAKNSSVTLDNQLQYQGLNEVDWAVPQNFVYGSMGGCLTVTETLAQLDLMRSKYPGLITVKQDASPTNQKTYGYAGSGGWAGQTVYYVKISHDSSSPTNLTVGDDANKPDILYTSMIHSRELISLMGNIYFMWYLLENYATDPAIKNLVDNNELYFVPIVNPDGLQWNVKNDPNGGGMNRTNLRGFSTGDPTNNSNYIENYGVDPNRNFNYLWGSAGDSSGSSGSYSSSTYRGPSAFSEPESQIMRDFILARNFKTAVWMHSYANAIPHPYGGIPTKVSGREDEMARWHQDMTRYNRYISGAQVLTPANGIADDWMVGGTADANGSIGSGQYTLATTPENGHYNEGGFWPSIANIIPIAKRMVRIQLMNAYYGGKYAKFHDLTQGDINSLSSNLTFGIERVGQTDTNFTLTVTPVSSNIQSITSPPTQTGMAKLEQRNVTAALVLNSGIQPNDKIEYKVALSNSDYTFYEVNIVKYYQPTVLFADNPDSDTSLANWVETTNWNNSTLGAYSGTRSIKGGATTATAYANNINASLTTTNSFDLSSSNEVIVQFYSKWDLERNYDFVELLGSPDGGSTWQPLKGNYNKPNSTSNTNDAQSSSFSPSKSSSYSFEASNSTGLTTNNNVGIVYDGDQMDNWVMEEIVINASINSFMQSATNAKFRFVMRTDSNNRPEKYSTTYDGFFLDDFKIIEVPCEVSIPINVVSSNVSVSTATINWDLVASTTYDLRYRKVGDITWIDVNDIATNSYNLSGLTPTTQYEVQVRSKCDASTMSAYSSSINFTTLAPIPCSGSTVNSFPYSESFENTLGLWSQETSSDDMDWTILSGGTPSNNTGPTGANNGNYYLYTEATGNGTGYPNKKAILNSPCIDLNGFKNASIQFDYNMNGADMGSLTLEASNDNWASNISLFTISGNQGASWVNQVVDLSAFDGQTVKLRFIGVTGSGYRSDISIDNFRLTADIDSSLGIDDEILSAFKIYPNPANNNLVKISLPNTIEKATITISNTLGQKVYSKKVQDIYNKAETINTSNFKTGIYFVTVNTNKGKATKKLLIL